MKTLYWASIGIIIIFIGFFISANINTHNGLLIIQFGFLWLFLVLIRSLIKGEKIFIEHDKK